MRRRGRRLAHHCAGQGRNLCSAHGKDTGGEAAEEANCAKGPQDPSGEGAKNPDGTKDTFGRLLVAETLKIKLNRRTGRYDVPVPVAGSNRRKWIPTGARTLDEARKIVAKSGVDRLVLLANANALTADALATITAGRRVSCSELLEGWKTENAGRLSDATLATYEVQLSALFNSEHCGGKTLNHVTREALDRFVNAKDAKYSSRVKKLAAIRSFYKYAKAHNYILENLADMSFVRIREMRVDQMERRPIFPLTESEYRAIQAAPDVAPFWKQVTAIAYWTGLRFIDCVALEWASVSEDFLVVWTKKRGKRVALPLDDPLLGGGELRAVFASIPRTDDTYCFPKERASYISGKRSKFPTAFKEILVKLGIAFKSFHSTRHAAITRMALAGRDIIEIGKLVGHGSPETTRIYDHSKPS